MKRLQDILSDDGNKTLYLDNYLYCDVGPSERLCEMWCYLIEGDINLKNEIYKSLPDNCKSLIKDLGISGINIFGYAQEQINKGTTDVINDIYKKCINTYISRIINEEINQRKNNEGKLKFIDGNYLVNMKRNLEGKLASPNSTNFNNRFIKKLYLWKYSVIYCIEFSFR